MWSQRDNFVSLPTDCPQRDERLGWTGDAQAFAPTACTLFDSQAFWLSWLADLSLDQDDDLGLPPSFPMWSSRARPVSGGPGGPMPPPSCPGRSTSPTAIRQFSSANSTACCAGSIRSLPGARPMGFSARRCSLETGSTPMLPGSPLGGQGRLGVPVQCLLLPQCPPAGGGGRALDKAPDMVEKYRAIAEEVAALTWERWGGHMRETQTGCAVALQFDIVPESERPEVAATLARMVREVGGRVSTGFLGTPLVLPALSSSGFYDEAYAMLLRNEFPSWLYQVEMGATTVWERWDAIRPDGSIHPGTMSHSVRGGRRVRGGQHALLQPLRIRGGHRLGVSAPRRHRPRLGPAWVSTNRLCPPARPPESVGHAPRSKLHMARPRSRGTSTAMPGSPSRSRSHSGAPGSSSLRRLPNRPFASMVGTMVIGLICHQAITGSR